MPFTTEQLTHQYEVMCAWKEALALRGVQIDDPSEVSRPIVVGEKMGLLERSIFSPELRTLVKDSNIQLTNLTHGHLAHLILTNFQPKHD